MKWPRLRVAISACLLGERVRFDGGHRRDDFVLGLLDRYVEWIPVCPEVEVGMGIPREPVILVGNPESPRLIGRRSGQDWTDRMEQWAAVRLEELSALDLDGFILKKGSPSCGLFRVPVYTESGTPRWTGPGLFARALIRRFPLLPIEEEGRLRDPILRERFIAALFTYRRWRDWQKSSPGPEGFIRFHTTHKLFLMARSPACLQHLGRLTAAAGKRWPAILQDYEAWLAKAMREPLSRGRAANALYHALGFLKHALPDQERQELAEHLRAYQEGRVPLVVPLTLFRHHIQKTSVPEWLRQQVLWQPYPEELVWRSSL